MNRLFLIESCAADATVLPYTTPQFDLPEGNYYIVKELRPGQNDPRTRLPRHDYPTKLPDNAPAPNNFSTPFGKLHHKLMVIDDTIVVAGSMNFTKPANIYNDENVLIIGNPYPHLLKVKDRPCDTIG